MKPYYQAVRNLYYIGISILVIYALPKIPFIKEYAYPILLYEPIPGLPVISLIAILTAAAAYMGYKHRTIG